MKTERLILASASPRRRELLKKITDDFDAVETHCAECAAGDPATVAIANATEKGERAEGEFVIAADTVVAFEGVIYGKPGNAERAARALKKLSGNEHSVITGVYVRHGSDIEKFATESRVKMKKLTDAEISDYVARYDPIDKAGGADIRDGVTVERYSGSLDNIIGLPTEHLRETLKKYIDVKE